MESSLHPSSCNPHNSVQSTIENWEEIKYNKSDFESTNKNGGMHQKWDKNLENGGHLVEQPETLVWDGMANVDISRYNRLECPIFLKSETATFVDVALHALVRQRLSIGTINRNLRYARFMENFVPREFSVDFRNLNYENVIRHLDYREQVEGCGCGALKHEWQAIRMFILAFGFNPDEWRYRPPKNPKYRTIPIVFPEQLHKILHTKYNKDYYVDSLIKHILCKNFLLVGVFQVNQVF